MNVQLQKIFNLPLMKIQKYFQSKKIYASGSWDEVLQEAHNKAFVVANVMRADMLQELYDRVDKAIGEGITFAQFKKDLPKTFGEEWKKRRLPTIYNTNLSVAYSRGRYESMIANKERRPYWRYKCQMLPTSRDSHKALNGKVFRADDPIWATLFPPNDWGCKCEVEPLTAEEVEAQHLTVERSEGKLAKAAFNLNKDVVQFTTGYKDPITGVVTAPAAGWNYNPGITDYRPDYRKYNDFFSRALKDWINLADMKLPFIEGKHTLIDDIIAVNPGFGEIVGTDTNCYSCVYAYEARKRGLDVISIPGEAISGDKVLSGFKERNFNKKYTVEKIKKEMKEFGDGARMEVLIIWEDDTSHVFVAEQIDGRTYFFDPQRKLFGCNKYFDDAIEIYAVRIDNALFSDNFTKFIQPKK